MIRSRWLAAATWLLAGWPAWSHDVRGLVEEMNSAIPEIEAALRATPFAEADTRSVISNLRLWTVPRKLTICFVGGPAVLRARVAASMQRVWPIGQLTGNRLTFDAASFAARVDCPDTSPNYDIRVGFKAGQGRFSYIGIESRTRFPSMNLAGLSENSPDDQEFDRLVGHETGHAIGLAHEHQSPDAPECKWNFNYLSDNFHWDSDADMHANIDKLQDYIEHEKHAYIFSTYDRLSLMHYAFQPDAFKDYEDDPCYIRANKVPSSQDKDAIRTAYGPMLGLEQTLTRGVAPALMTQFSGADYARLRKLLQVKVELLQ